jgi:glycerol kinase
MSSPEEEQPLSADSQSGSIVLAIDQGTTNTKAALVTAEGQVVRVGSAPVGVTSPQAGWVEQDAMRIWASVLEAVASCAGPSTSSGHDSTSSGHELAELAGIALSTQRESVVGWRGSTGEPLGPVIGWQDSRTASWCADVIDDRGRTLVHDRTGLRVDAMFSAPKFRWLLDHLPAGVPVDDVRLGTVDSWLIWQLTGGVEHVCEAGNASRTLLYDVRSLDWSPELLDLFGISAGVLPAALASDVVFGRTAEVGMIPAGVPIVAVLADSHAALYGQGCTEPGMAKATYGTGSSVMTPVAQLPSSDSPVPTTLAWLIGGNPTYALEGNILSSGATLAWAAELLTAGDVSDLLKLADTVPDSGGVTLIPAFSGLGAPHWDRDAHALLSGMTNGTQSPHLARAAVDSIAHQICDIVDVMEDMSGPLQTFRADGGATASELLMQTQADLLHRTVEVADVAEVSALGAAKLGWKVLGRGQDWPDRAAGRSYQGELTTAERESRRNAWAGEIARACFNPARPTT